MMRDLITVCRCGRPFNASRSGRMYCSSKCKIRYYMRDRRRSQRIRIRIECSNKCGVTFTTSKMSSRFCSPKCRCAYHRREKVNAA